MIRHGEKPPKVNGKDQDGLSELGVTRAKRLVQFFGVNSPYNIGLILAEKPKGGKFAVHFYSHTLTDCSDGSRSRPLDTITPLYKSLTGPDSPDLQTQFTVQLDASISRDDAAKVAKHAKKYQGPGNVLICWEHGQLTDIAQAIGIDPPPTYPGDHYDIIWKIESPYTKIEEPWGSEDGDGTPGSQIGVGQNEVGQ